MYLEKIKAGKLDEVPDILVTIRPEFRWQKDQIINSQALDDEYQYDIDSELKVKNILDDNWILKPVFIMPLVIFYNKDIENPPESWSDLLDERFKGKIATTDEATPPAALLKRFFKQTKGEEGEAFVENSVNYIGLPIDVNRAVSRKEYDIGIMPLSFAMFSKDNATGICWPKEGALYLTQVMLMKKGYTEDSKKIADYLVSYEAQKMFSEGASFIPVRPDIEVPKLYAENNQSLLSLSE
ncbi:ABC transporter substrate-binding protein [Vibrio sp. JC009]|uniref:ABC transporter substrate-binding protein n=1 Tax=Vibrio sp. JC009 TaxID=2912314 RepID=UPI0023AF208F|nr:ABC transporter substrate-binding protein [Vibrio sp. JC009]WED23850.1 ABC transporter substrate-binding protein [Vibrio sp. JC009]